MLLDLVSDGRVSEARIDESARRLLAASIDPSRRGETLGVADFVRLLQRSDDSEERVRLV